jgi:nanoRNase/pAp phosphatase (c-di-AMP/oligoRNAs hydrolase)
MNVHQILELPDVVERVDVYEEQTKLFKEMLKKHTRVEKDVIITDLRDINHPMYAGNRFIVYSLYPQQNISVWIAPGKREQGHGVKSCSVAVGHSVLNRTSKVDVGSLMLKFGGGGHKMVGTCQLADDIVDRDLPKILDAIINHK